MILVIDATATDSDGNVLSGSVAVTVNTPSDGTPAEQAAAPPPAGPQLAPFQQRSMMIARGWGSR
jgi:hypothetical protein